MRDLDQVGGKNASLGEMLSHLTSLGVSVPGGFATTADAFREFMAHAGLAERVNRELAKLNVDNVVALAETGARIRQWVAETPLPPALEKSVREGYAALGGETAVAVRS